MMFRVGLNCDVEELVPLTHFGDGYISMFVMAVIQAIAESKIDDKCLFLFEEPESFLHENHQEYFYKIVLCKLANNGHQVIYTTHSDKMIDIFDTRGIIKIDFNEEAKQTVIKYNEVGKFESSFSLDRLKNYNSFIKSIEPNLNKILFSRKVVFVEGPNDLMAYNYAVEKKASEIMNDEIFAKTYLSFSNIVIVPHHGKETAFVLIELCKHLKIDFFLINDWDLEEDFQNLHKNYSDLAALQQSEFYLKDKGAERLPSSKKTITTNWKLINLSQNKIHFNVRKLEKVLQYPLEDKSSVGIWKRLKEIESFSESFFPKSLENFLELDRIKINSYKKSKELVAFETEYSGLPF